METFEAQIYVHGFHNKGATQLVTVIDPIMRIGQTPCLECEGDGWWGYGPTEAECGLCIDCKGTGKIYVSI